MKLRKRSKLLLIIVIFALFILNWKAIGRYLYPIKYSNVIEKHAKVYNIDPFLVASVIKVESNFEQEAVSVKDARGLMQLTPSTSKWVAEKLEIEDFNVNMLFKSETNIMMGCWYINDLKKEFGNNMKVVLAAYNGGRGNVKKWLINEENSKDGINLYYIPFKETDQYVKRVEVYYNLYKLLYTNDNNYVESMKKVFYMFFS